MVPLSLLCFALSFVLGQPKVVGNNSSSSEVDDFHSVDFVMALNNTNPLTSHVLDTAIGRPAPGIKVVLHKMEENGDWRAITEQFTDADGRVGHMIPGPDFTPGVYKLHFDTLSYYTSRGEKTFYPYIQVVFEIEKPEEHYHVPILLSAYGFATYRGS